MAREHGSTKPVIGMTLTFKAEAAESLAGVPAHVVDIWPRFRSGDYLVTLEYAQPVKVGNELVRHIDAFVSELSQLSESDVPLQVREVGATHSVQARH